MVLPLLAGMLGSGLASAGMLGATGFLANPLIAGSIGSGLGQFAQTGDVKEGLKTGLGSYLGGAALGKAFGGADFNVGKMTADQFGASQFQGVSPEQFADEKALTGAYASQGDALSKLNATRSVIDTQRGLDPNFLGGPKGIFTPEFSSGLQAATGQGVMGGGLGQLGSAAGVGQYLGGMAAMPDYGTGGIAPEEEKESRFDGREVRPVPRVQNQRPTTFRPGYDGEFDYGISTPQSADDLYNYNYRNGGMLRRMSNPRMMGQSARLARGGIVSLADGGVPEAAMTPQEAPMAPTEAPMASQAAAMPNEQEVIVGAARAIKGIIQGEEAQMALAMFVQQYGEQKLRQLVTSVNSGEFDQTIAKLSTGEGGMVQGPTDGSGTDDMMPARLDDQQILLTDNEYVVKAPTSEALGEDVLDVINEGKPETVEAVKKAAMGGYA
ncbi:MAG: hypothetical protein CMK24_00715 [Porticoccaceae bacterium]|nr:hypothetical protein [Porticoccaceae bacterium]|tara:strand:+ start:10921 stop:12237 length:1317 start_codon:yes stop_codon:yes gene_type:complete